MCIIGIWVLFLGFACIVTSVLLLGVVGVCCMRLDDDFACWVCCLLVMCGLFVLLNLRVGRLLCYVYCGFIL